MKYYITILMVLRLAQSGGNQGEKSKLSPLNVDLSKVELLEHSFVSIHVALFNEKKVVERLIRACTSQNWLTADSLRQSLPSSGQAAVSSKQLANYEVVIVDDSTDETTEIAKQVLVEGLGYRGVRTFYDDELETFVFTAVSGEQNAVSILPTVKLIHRFSRSGFKGGALQKALENTDSRAEYISVFDADFVPYPDTIEQFVKTFQVLNADGLQPASRGEQTADSNEQLAVSGKRSAVNNIAAVQGYQWHVLNKSQTWVTRGVRTEYAGSYVIERSGAEIYGGLKQIAGSVYMIRADVLRGFGWGTSITEDFELTLRLYENGWKVAFTPYIQAPAEAVSTIKKLIRQRMRWAEGASHNIKIMLPRMLFGRWQTADSLQQTALDQEAVSGQQQAVSSQKVWVPSRLTTAEKFEFAYLAPYYLQAAFFVVGTLSWFLSEAVLHSHLPFWTAAFGWSLVFTNLLALPLMNIIGLFLEESDERDYVGILSFILISYIVVPFQAYAAIKGFLESSEGPWFRTPKSGIVTDVVERTGFGKFFGNILGRPSPLVNTQGFGTASRPAVNLQSIAYRLPTRFASVPVFSPLQGANFKIRPRHVRYIGNLTLGLIITITIAMSLFAPFIPVSNSYASQNQLKTVGDVKNSEQTADPQNPPDKEDIIKNALSEEIKGQRAIQKKMQNGEKVEVIFDSTPKVRIKLDQKEIEFKTLQIGAKNVDPQKATIYQDKEVIYHEVIAGVDLKYTVGDDLLVEEFIVKTPEAGASFAEASKATVEQTIKTVDVKVVSPDSSTFGFYDDNGKEVFKFSSPFAKDAKGERSNDLSLALEKDYIGHKLTKSLGLSARDWLADPKRVYPVSIDPSVIVSTGIVDADVAYGGLQRKVVYVSSNWYSFYNDGTDVLYKKSSDGSSWGSAVDVDTTDADNLNPSVWLEGSLIYVAWIDDTTDNIEVNTINTASSDALGTKCTSADQGSLDSTNMVSVAVADNGTVYLAYSDTLTDTEFGVFKLVFSGCTFTEIRNPLDAASSTKGSATNTLTWSHTVAGSNRILIVGTSFEDGADTAVSSITYNSVALTSIGSQASVSGIERVELWYLLAPDTGTHDIIVTWADTVDNPKAGATSWTDVNQSTPLGTFAPATGNSGSVTVNVSSAVGEVVVDVVASSDNDGLSPGAGQIRHWFESETSHEGAGSSESGASTTTMSYSLGDANDWAIGAVPLKLTGNYAGIYDGDRPVLIATGNTLHMIYQDGDLSHSVYDGSSWTTSNTTIASVTDNIYSVTTDGTNLWVLTVSGTTATNFYKFNGSTWSTLTAPWTSETNLTSVSITYDSTNSDLYAHVIKDTSEQAYFKSTDATTISWGTESSYGFTAGDLGHISAPMTGAGTSQIGVVLRQGTNFEFAPVPERSLFLLAALPFLPKALRKLKKKK